MSTPTSPSSLPRVYLKLVLTALCWGALFHLGRYVVGFMSPLAAAAWRFALAALIFMPLVAWREGWSFAGLRRNALVLGVMASVGVFGFNTGLFYGLQHTSAVNGALIVGFNPALTAVLAALINRRVPSRFQMLGLVLGLSGVAVVVSRGSWQTLASLQLAPGDALVLVAAMCWGVYTVLPQRFVSGLAPLQVAASTVIGGAVLMMGFAAAIAPDFAQVPPVGGIVAIVVMAVFGSVLAYLWWNDGLKVVGPTQAAIFMNFVPIFAALIGVVRGEHLSAAQLVGAALVIGGVLASTLLGRKPAVTSQVTGADVVRACPARAPGGRVTAS